MVACCRKLIEIDGGAMTGTCLDECAYGGWDRNCLIAVKFIVSWLGSRARCNMGKQLSGLALVVGLFEAKYTYPQAKRRQCDRSLCLFNLKHFRRCLIVKHDILETEYKLNIHFWGLFFPVQWKMRLTLAALAAQWRRHVMNRD